MGHICLPSNLNGIIATTSYYCVILKIMIMHDAIKTIKNTVFLFSLKKEQNLVSFWKTQNKIFFWNPKKRFFFKKQKNQVGCFFFLKKTGFSQPWLDLKKMRPKSKCSRIFVSRSFFGVFFGQFCGNLGKNPLHLQKFACSYTYVQGLVKRSWLWETKIYVRQYRSCFQFRCKWQAMIREESRLQNGGFKWCNLILSRPEVPLTFFVLLCK